PLKGIVLLDHYLPATLRDYEALGLRVVLADHVPFGRKLGSVSVDNRAAARDAVLRLAAAGHRRIAFVRRVLYHLADVDPDSRERMEGYFAALKEAGLPARNEAVFNMLPEKSLPTYPLRPVFKAQPAYTAAVCADGTVAEVLERAAREMGREVPRDFGIVCFQNQRAPSPYSGPACDFEVLGLEAARLFARWTSPAPQVRVPCVWRERHSFVAPKA
ncbi:MAG: LacI family DNA-binding transcriptional regulator, partial [Planctomycetota bacterium]|nr:LacI family DNA-binding transcriptional regulator [Planctomycetota bacterium]